MRGSVLVSLAIICLFVVVNTRLVFGKEHPKGKTSAETNFWPQKIQPRERDGGESDESIVAFGSCSRPENEQYLWDEISKHKPDTFAWIGDAVYADRRAAPLMWEAAPIADMESLWHQQRSVPSYLKFRTTSGVKILGTWDDHDYGLNDGDEALPFKKESQRIYLDFLDEPQDSPRRAQDGIFASYTIGDDFHLILLDVRSHLKREPWYKRWDESGDGTMLGDEQWAWLEDQLANSKAKVKVLFSGLQIVADDKFVEHWGNVPRDRRRLMEVIHRANASGVMSVSGDVHMGELNVAACTEAGYPFFDLTSSGLTDGPWRVQKVLRRFIPKTYQVPGTNRTYDSNYGMIKFNRKSEQLSLEVHTRDGPYFKYVVPLSYMTPHGAPWECAEDRIVRSYQPLTGRVVLILIVVFIGCSCCGVCVLLCWCYLARRKGKKE